MIKKFVVILIACFGFIVTHAQEPGNALNFNGVFDYVLLGDNDGMTAVTIETWVYYQEDGLKFICSKGLETLEIHTNTGGNIRFIPTTGVYIDAYGVLSVGQWSHIACVYDPAQPLAKIYVNGREVLTQNNGTNPITTAIVENTNNFRLGIRSDATYPFKGSLDELSIWDTARTSSEIFNDFDTVIVPESEENLVSYYNFNQGIAGGDNTDISSLTDLKGNFNGILTNFTLNGETSNFCLSMAMAKPINLYATDITDTTFVAHWQVPEFDVQYDFYKLYLAYDSLFQNPLSGYNPRLIPASGNSYEIDSLIINSEYYFRLSLYNSSSQTTGIYSETKSVKTKNFNGSYITQIGNTLFGGDLDDFFGCSVSANGNGNIVAVGISGGGYGYTGQVKVYENINDNWFQQGDVERFYQLDEQFGKSVSLSKDGLFLAAGAPEYDGTSTNGGRFYCFEFLEIDNHWENSNATNGTGNSGSSVCLNADGTIVAVGAYADNAYTGKVKIYNCSSAVQIGNDIVGQAEDDRAGVSVSLSDDGNIVAIGAINNDNIADNAGNVRVFQNIEGVWTQIGSDINGLTAEGSFGYSVSLNSNGTILAVGEPFAFQDPMYVGCVKVYEFIDNEWSLKGDPIYGGFAHDQMGSSVCLDSTGTVLAVNALSNIDSLHGGLNAGRNIIYKFKNDNWVAYGSEIYGDMNGDAFGSALSLSKDASTLVLGSKWNDSVTINAGMVKIYNICFPVTPPIPDSVQLSDVYGQCSVSSLIIPTAVDECGISLYATTETIFPITTQGTTEVTWVFEDINGNISTQSQNVVINDDTAPVSNLPDLPDITSECEVTELTAPTATDNCFETITVTHDASLPITTQGTTIVTWTYDDGNGNTSTQMQNVIINDVTAPVADIVTLPDITAECEVTELTAPTAADNCSGIITVTHGATLPITTQGTTIVTWTYDDGNGNTSTQTQDIVIEDVTAPAADLSTLSDITAECEVTELTAPTATDNCSGIITVTHSASLPITTQGTTIITWTYEDENGNTSTQMQNVIIDDVTAPVEVIATLLDIIAECEVTELAAPTATDNCSGIINGTHDVALPITTQGTTVVTWTYDDGNGNMTTQIQNVVIDDITSPVANLSTLPDITTECEITELTAPTATDNCAGIINGTPDATLPITTQGTTVVTWTYDDGNGNTATQTQNIDISHDVTAPVANLVTLPDITTECEVTELTAPTATDNCAGIIPGTHDAALPITAQGTTIVTWTYDDGNGNTTTQTQNIVIDDITEPTIICAENQIINLNEGETNYTVQVTEFDPVSTDDNCGIAGILNDFNNTSSLSNAQLNAGTHSVVWTVTDIAGNITTCNLEIEVNSFVNISEIALIGISIYPNPNTGLFSLEFTRPLEEGSIIIIYSVTGMEIKSIVTDKPRGDNTVEVDLLGIMPGLYFVKIITSDANTIKTFVVQ